jgi:4-hydroxy-tetrahydrodipicolinate synthase
VTDLLPETVCELANKFPGQIVGIKDASGDLSRVTDHRRDINGAFDQLCGDDELWLSHNAAGGVGCISVTANVAPKLCADFQAAIAANDLATARELNDRLYPLHYAMFEDASPAPVKYALSRVHNWLNGSVRLPIIPCSEDARKAVDAALEHAGLV